MDHHSVCPFYLPSYRQLRISYEAETKSLWYFLDPKPRPAFNEEILGEIRDFQSRVTGHLQGQPEKTEIRYLVLASDVPGVFNLGGDLSLFAKLIKEKNRDQLISYARLCVDAVYHNATNLGIPGLTTISLVQGAALGGGFEAALSSHLLIAERDAEMGFPEILFNLFPGMGACSLLTRRLNRPLAEQLLESGALKRAEELHDIGLVHQVVENGEGIPGVRQFIRKHMRESNGRCYLQEVWDYMNPLSYTELLDIAMVWVDAAMRVTPRDLRKMARLVEAQNRRKN
ncbi:MAG: crotonase/enoyl-CoA hydratase family protein [Candidatus Manganitrophaceae bacterium]